MINIKKIILISNILFIVNSCKNDVPNNKEVIGTWKSTNNTIFHFNSDNTFYAQKVPTKVFSESENYSQKNFNGKGIWKINDKKLCIDLEFTYISIRSGHLITYLNFEGSGILENKTPWKKLFIWIGDPDDGNRYELEKLK